MSRNVLKDEQWERIEDLFPDKRSNCGVAANNNWLFVGAVLWLARTGSP